MMATIVRAIVRAGADVQFRAGDGQLRIRRDHIHVTSLHPQAFGDLHHRKRRLGGEQFHERAGMLRRQVLDEDD